MKLTLRINKDGTPLYEGVHEIIDHQSCGEAFAKAWGALHAKRMEETTSVGQLMEILNDEVLELLQGAEITIERARTR